MLKKVVLLVLFSFCLPGAQAQDMRSRWVDSVFATLSLEKKVGQLFMVPLSTYADESRQEELITLLRGSGIGGIYITAGGPISHANLLNQLQKNSKVPLISGISAEWGLAQTLDSTMGFQKPMVSSAWKKDSLTSVWAKQIALQMKVLGLHINFAPNADDEVFFGDYLRYFGNSKASVAKQAVAFNKAMQEEGILTVAKHLPRRQMPENSLSKDSTSILNLTNVDSSDFFAFKQLIDHGVNGIFTSYLHFSMQNEKGIVPAAVSQTFISEVLKKKLEFKGLVFANVKDFEKTAGKVRAGEAELLAFETGNDVLFGPLNVKAASKKISRRIKKVKLLQQQLDISVKKILGLKYDAGLNHPAAINTDNLTRKLHSPSAYLVKHQLAEAAVTVVRNKNNFLPIRSLENNSFVCLSIGKDAENDFSHLLGKYAPFQSFSIKQARDTIQFNPKPSDIIVIGVFPYFDVVEKEIAGWINRLAEKQQVVLAHFGNPASIERYTNATALIAAYTEQDFMTEVVPQVIFGGTAATGVLPFDLTSVKAGQSVATELADRFAYSTPEAGGLDSRTLEKIKTIMTEAVALGATPGCHVLVARNGKVIYQESVGTLTYGGKQPITDQTIFDLASVTKVSATLQTVMFMQERGLIDINKKASAYLPELKESNKKDFLIKDILTHQSGLWPGVPFWAITMKDSLYLPEYYNTTQSPDYPYAVAPELYASKNIRDSLWQWTIKAKIREKPLRTPYDYRYSDMGFYIMQHIAEKILNQPMEDFLDQNLYGPIGAYTTGYLPLEKFSPDRIAPTEDDRLFRKKLLTGYVHDQGAAMLGGVAGHAGLFSTANDLAKLGQFWLQKGHYGGYQFLKPETVDLFTNKQFEGSRRGLGWDKPTISEWGGPTSMYASPKTFGHTGFTGTCIWVDPEFNLVYVFLSNRVHPDMNNNKLLSANIRTRIQDVIYEAIFNYCENKN